MDLRLLCWIPPVKTASRLCLLAGIMCLFCDAAHAGAWQSLMRLADEQPVASINFSSRTIPLKLAPYPDDDSPAYVDYSPPMILRTPPRTALPRMEVGLVDADPPSSRETTEAGKSMVRLAADTSRSAPGLSGFKPLNKENFFGPPPYLQKLWDDVLQRHTPEAAFGRNQPLMNKYRKQQWDNIVSGWRGMDRDKQLRVINGFFNNWPSKSDMENYGKKEYWATPEEMLRKGSGDCEDYAIMKYLALRYLKWPTKDMWLVLVQDRKKKTHHAVLAARYDSQTFILDNLSKPRYLLIPEETYMKSYMPFYAINENSSWIFAMPKQRKNPADDSSFVGVAESDQVMKR